MSPRTNAERPAKAPCSGNLVHRDDDLARPSFSGPPSRTVAEPSSSVGDLPHLMAQEPSRGGRCVCQSMVMEVGEPEARRYGPFRMIPAAVGAGGAEAASTKTTRRRAKPQRRARWCRRRGPFSPPIAALLYPAQGNEDGVAVPARSGVLPRERQFHPSSAWPEIGTTTKMVRHQWPPPGL